MKKTRINQFQMYFPRSTSIGFMKVHEEPVSIGFKHEDDWQVHSYGCECNKCYSKFMENFASLLKEVNS